MPVYPLVKLLFGILFCFLGLGYLYRPSVISRLNAFLREYLFNDAYIVLDRRKWGTLSMMVGILLLYMGWTSWK
ncbi:MAG: hypothetical protein HY400_04040 [Elusimicrobia bacterium]|nr:hypothetical protein [Elusimicrobiota bacterium]